MFSGGIKAKHWLKVEWNLFGFFIKKSDSKFTLFNKWNCHLKEWLFCQILSAAVFSKCYIILLFPFLMNTSTTFKTSVSIRDCSWIKFKFPSRSLAIVLLHAVFNLLIPEATCSASVDPVGGRLAFLKVFVYLDSYHYPLGLMLPLNYQVRRPNCLHVFHQCVGFFALFVIHQISLLTMSYSIFFNVFPNYEDVLRL